MTTAAVSSPCKLCGGDGRIAVWFHWRDEPKPPYGLYFAMTTPRIDRCLCKRRWTDAGWTDDDLRW